MATIGVGELPRARGGVRGDQEDEVDELRAVGGGAAPRDEAGAAVVKPLSVMVGSL